MNDYSHIVTKKLSRHELTYYELSADDGEWVVMNISNKLPRSFMCFDKQFKTKRDATTARAKLLEEPIPLPTRRLKQALHEFSSFKPIRSNGDRPVARMYERELAVYS